MKPPFFLWLFLIWMCPTLLHSMFDRGKSTFLVSQYFSDNINNVNNDRKRFSQVTKLNPIFSWSPNSSSLPLEVAGNLNFDYYDLPAGESNELVFSGTGLVRYLKEMSPTAQLRLSNSASRFKEPIERNSVVNQVLLHESDFYTEDVNETMIYVSHEVTYRTLFEYSFNNHVRLPSLGVDDTLIKHLFEGSITKDLTHNTNVSIGSSYQHGFFDRRTFYYDVSLSGGMEAILSKYSTLSFLWGAQFLRPSDHSSNFEPAGELNLGFQPFASFSSKLFFKKDSYVTLDTSRYYSYITAGVELDKQIGSAISVLARFEYEDGQLRAGSAPLVINDLSRLYGVGRLSYRFNSTLSGFMRYVFYNYNSSIDRNVFQLGFQLHFL